MRDYIDYSENDPSDDDFEGVFILELNDSVGDPYYQFGVWFGTCFMELEHDSGGLVGPVRGVKRYCKLSF